jgi:hypothetical protein
MPTDARPPAKLGKAGRDLFKQIVDVYELRPDEVRILLDACREADLVDRLEKALSLEGELTTEGSMGQLVITPLLSEIRQHRAVLANLLKALKLPAGKPGEPDEKASVAEAARKAARARWDRPRQTG